MGEEPIILNPSEGDLSKTQQFEVLKAQLYGALQKDVDDKLKPELKAYVESFVEGYKKSLESARIALGDEKNPGTLDERIKDRVKAEFDGHTAKRGRKGSFARTALLYITAAAAGAGGAYGTMELFYKDKGDKDFENKISQDIDDLKGRAEKSLVSDSEYSNSLKDLRNELFEARKRISAHDADLAEEAAKRGELGRELNAAGRKSADFEQQLKKLREELNSAKAKQPGAEPKAVEPKPPFIPEHLFKHEYVMKKWREYQLYEKHSLHEQAMKAIDDILEYAKRLK